MSTSNFHLTKHTLPCQYIHQYPRATRNNDSDELQLAINQYTPRDNSSPQPGDVTIIAAHANGVPKEMYEPLWDDLLEWSRKSNGFKIRNIWMADVAHQGESGVLNETKLGNDPSWFDHPRDLLHMVNHFRDSISRPILGLGHSMGGNNIVNLSLMHPRLFHGVILIDPVIQRITVPNNLDVSYLSTFRRDIWPSRATAEQSMRKNKFYQSWDPRCLELWLHHGLRELPTQTYPKFQSTETKPVAEAALLAVAASTAAPVPPATDLPVTLTTTKAQEVFTFMRPVYPSPGMPLDSHKTTRQTHPDLPEKPIMPFYRPEAVITFHNLPFLRPQCLYVFATGSAFASLGADKLAVTGTGIGGSGGVAEGAVEEIMMQDCGHFAPFEKPVEVAGHVGTWMERQLRRWADEEDRERREWADVPAEQKANISEAWIYWMKQKRKMNGGGRGGSAKAGGSKL